MKNTEKMALIKEILENAYEQVDVEDWYWRATADAIYTILYFKKEN